MIQSLGETEDDGDKVKQHLLRKQRRIVLILRCRGGDTMQVYDQFSTLLTDVVQESANTTTAVSIAICQLSNGLILEPPPRSPYD